MKLFIIRHGESQTNIHLDKVKKPAEMNSYLTKFGENQAKKLAAWMKTKIKKVDLIISSSLIRAQQTARPIAESYGLNLRQEHRLRESGYNFSDGNPMPDDLLPINKMIDWHTLPFEPFDDNVVGCESFTDVKERMANFLDEMTDTHLGKTIVVVTHRWAMNALFDVIFNTCVFRQCFYQVENTAISYFEYNPEWKLGPWYAHFIGQTPQLEFYPDGIE
jgi:probable phosphoglycerate mutase